ncbi:Cell division protein FtsH [Devosia sp. LC5]|uniref:AAA family ATPase n=1 Tax=Devosia sp. LC5 TaxID=1502724 RepID=UPI0004E2D512|nr:AAA family ATPase [Devosia sp. LC5]KFC68203.1 Cell division protein FtsH [Devosia sp. LC5]
MSIASLRSPSPDTETDDEPHIEDNAPPPLAERTSDALAQCMLEAALTPALKRLLKARPRLVVIRTAEESSAGMLERYLSGQDRSTMVAAYTERQKIGGRYEPQGRTELDLLEKGRSVILISQDPERVLVPEALAGADAIITVPDPDLAIIRKTIRMVTGRPVRGLLPIDVEGLSIHDLTVAIRPGLSSRDCIFNLRRIANARQKQDEGDAPVPLEQLAMTRAASDWAFETLALMRHVTDGKVDASALRFACLEGPPGTGKTTIAAALARSAGYRLVSTSVGSWFADSGGHLGDVIRAARKFFDDIALSNDPVVGLLDEIDAIPDRASMDADDASWWTPVVTFLLTEIDRLRKLGKPILLIGATNHFDKLDKALIRPGRLEHKVSVLLPDFDDRRRMFAAYIGDRIDAGGIAALARLAVEATPAQIESWCRSANARTKTEDRPLELADLMNLIAPSNGRSPETDRGIAIHEAGHAVVAHTLNLPILEVSILGAGTMGGWVKPKLKDGVLTRGDVENLVTMVLAGRAADVTLGDGANSGAESDLEIANTVLRSAMLDLGLYGPLTTVQNIDPRHWNNGSLWTAIAAELDRLHDRAVRIVSRRRADIFRLVEILQVERVIIGDRLAEILEAGPTAEKPDKTDDAIEDHIPVAGRI